MGDRIRTFRNARCRLLRLGEGRWHAGWTRHMAQDEVRLRLKSFAPLDRGDEVIVECYGDGTLARFRGRVCGQSGQEVAVRVVGSMGFETSLESIRIFVEGITGVLHTDEGDFELLIADVSPASLGGLTTAFPGLGTRHGLRVEWSGETIECDVSVANCRLDPSEAGWCRVGLRIVGLSRLASARWQGLVEDATAR